MSSAWLAFNAFVFFDTTQGIASSVLRASGRQKYGAIITGVTYFAIGIPFTCLMVFKVGLETSGIWMGPVLACALNTGAYLFIFSKIDWAVLIVESRE
jgi:Na+-driven multidrug efflux pump